MLLGDHICLGSCRPISFQGCHFWKMFGEGENVRLAAAFVVARLDVSRFLVDIRFVKGVMLGRIIVLRFELKAYCVMRM